MRPLLSAIFLCGGCSARQSPEPVANHQATSALACSGEVIERLQRTLTRRWGSSAPLRCEPGQFRTAGFFIEARIDGGRRTGIVDASGAELVPFRDEPPADPFTYISGYRAADLDGDGEDEIIESWRRSYHMADSEPDTWLVVRVVSGQRLRRIRGPYVNRSHPDLGACTGTWQLRSGAIDLSVQVLPGIPPTDCLPAGRHRFSLRGGALVVRRR